MPERPLLVVFSPLPPAMNGIADYTARLLPALAQRYRPLVVVPDDAPAPIAVPGSETILLSAYRRQAARLAGERHLFQIGNNAGHIYAMPWIERIGGVVTVHDATMLHMTHWFASNEGAGTGQWRRFVREADAVSARMVDHADDLATGSGAVGSDVPVLRPFLSGARCVIVHSALAASRVLAAVPEARVRVIAHHADMPVPEAPSHGSAVQLLCIGFASRSKRIDLVLRALRLLVDAGLALHLTIAGEVRPEEVDLETLVAGLGLEGAVTFSGYLDDEAIDPLIAASDLVINLRDPTSGETSGTLSRAMALGRCAVVSDVGWYAELPDRAVVKIELGRVGPDRLAQRLWPFVTDASLRREVGCQARAWIGERASLADVVESYAQAIEQAHADVSPAAGMHLTSRAFSFLPLQAMPAVSAAARRVAPLSDALWWQERLLPLCDGQGRLGTIGCSEGDAALAGLAFGWFEVIDKGPAANPLPSSSIDGLLVRLAANAAPDPPTGLLDVLAQCRPSSVTVECTDAFAPPPGLAGLLAERSYVLAREATGPQVPLLDGPCPRWTAPQWAATFVERRSWRA